MFLLMALAFFCNQSTAVRFDVKMGNPRSLFNLFSSFQPYITIFLQQINLKHVHSVYGAGI